MLPKCTGLNELLPTMHRRNSYLHGDDSFDDNLVEQPRVQILHRRLVRLRYDALVMRQRSLIVLVTSSVSPSAK